MRGSRFDLSWARSSNRVSACCVNRSSVKRPPNRRKKAKFTERKSVPLNYPSRAGGQVDPSSLVHEGAFQSLALTACTRARARHSTTLLPGTRASFGTRAAALAWHPLSPPNRRMPRCTMSSMPATTLATADKMELRMVTQRSTIGASSSSSAASPVLFTREVAPHHVIRASQQGRPRGGGRRVPREDDRLELRFGHLGPLRFRHLTTPTSRD